MKKYKCLLGLLGMLILTSPLIPQISSSAQESFECPCSQDENIVAKSLATVDSISIPSRDNQKESKISLGVKIINRSNKPIRILQLGKINLELITPENKIVNAGLIRDITRMPTEADAPLILPQEYILFWYTFKLFWQDNSLKLSGDDNFNGRWIVSDIKPGKYKFRFSYSNLPPYGKRDAYIYDTKSRQFIRIDDLWLGFIIGSLEDLYIANDI